MKRHVIHTRTLGLLSLTATQYTKQVSIAIPRLLAVACDDRLTEEIRRLQVDGFKESSDLLDVRD